MSGCRALSDTEITQIKNTFERQRDRTLFVLGNRTGWRISQLLSVQLKHFMKHGQISDTIRIERHHTKGKFRAQECPLHSEAKEEIYKLVQEQYGVDFTALDTELYLFKSRKGSNKPIRRDQAHKILKSTVNFLELSGKIATHSCRKSFGSYIYKASGNNLLVAQRALNHAHISSTINYLDVNQEEVNKLIKEMK